jgi:hypothetical protein
LSEWDPDGTPRRWDPLAAGVASALVSAGRPSGFDRRDRAYDALLLLSAGSGHAPVTTTYGRAGRDRAASQQPCGLGQTARDAGGSAHPPAAARSTIPFTSRKCLHMELFGALATRTRAATGLRSLGRGGLRFCRSRTGPPARRDVIERSIDSTCCSQLAAGSPSTSYSRSVRSSCNPARGAGSGSAWAGLGPQLRATLLASRDSDGAAGGLESPSQSSIALDGARD